MSGFHAGVLALVTFTAGFGVFWTTGAFPTPARAWTLQITTGATRLTAATKMTEGPMCPVESRWAATWAPPIIARAAAAFVVINACTARAVPVVVGNLVVDAAGSGPGSLS